MNLKNICAIYYWPLLLALAIFCLSGTRTPATPDLSFEFQVDKLGHFLMFGLLGTLIVRMPQFRKSGWSRFFLALALTSGYGAFDELRQSLTPGRSVEFADWCADTAGAVVAIIAYRHWKFYRSILEWSPRVPASHGSPVPQPDVVRKEPLFPDSV